MSTKVIATNRKAYHNYHIEESIESGISLTGSEIKSIRAGRVSLGDAYVRPEGGELWLVNAHIARHDSSSYMSHEPLRRRKLLLHRKEILNLTSRIKEKGLTLIPVKMYFKGHLVKLAIAFGMGKKLYDKREAIAKRDSERELARAVKKRLMR